MLRRTADCSLQALANFQGDPLTDAYAAKVRLCGVQALDATVASTADVESLVSAICERAQECDAVKDDEECRTSLLSDEGPRIGRAIGAISRPGREALQACVATAPCGDLHTMVLTCLEPIMDRLLWLPE
jgi:sorbitol-specific phosphotransferase system component IIBC